jgi:uncharacterized RDD family membrane protein YckC
MRTRPAAFQPCRNRAQAKRLPHTPQKTASLLHLRNSTRAMMGRSFTGTSAAQNIPVIRICSKCGALLMDDAEGCSFCEVPEDPAMLQPVTAGKAEEDETVEPEWRQEVNRRLQQYRARRRGAAIDETQTDLPFREPPKPAREQQIEIPERPQPRPVAKIAPRVRGMERMEIRIQPELDFSPAPGERARPQTALVPVATLAERRNAGALDALFILLTCAAFAGLFIGLLRSMGGEIPFDKMDAIICIPVAYLFYSLYFLVFTVFAGTTPGMQFSGLAVVRLDGHLPDTGQLLWRGFGYMLSGATLMLGFLWASWDEDTFTWQDRISQTYVTSTNPLTDPDPIEITPRQRFRTHR